MVVSCYCYCCWCFCCVSDDDYCQALLTATSFNSSINTNNNCSTLLLFRLSWSSSPLSFSLFMLLPLLCCWYCCCCHCRYITMSLISAFWLLALLPYCCFCCCCCCCCFFFWGGWLLLLLLLLLSLSSCQAMLPLLNGWRITTGAQIKAWQCLQPATISSDQTTNNKLPSFDCHWFV